MSFPKPQPAAIPFARAYAPPAQLRDEIRRLHGTSLPRSVATAAADHAAILVLITLTLGSYRLLVTRGALPAPLALLLAATVAVLSLIGIGRFQRGLECLVHEASHNNWDRRHPGRNDRVAAVLAAAPVISTVRQYRVGHFVHHRKLGTREDPDLERYLALDVEALDRTSGIRFALGIARRLPRYLVGWWGAIGTNRMTVLKSLAWHGLVIVLPVALLAGPLWALAVWADWLAGFVIALPVIRFIGEAGEHKYVGAETLFDATMVNDGRIHRLADYSQGWVLLVFHRHLG